MIVRDSFFRVLLGAITLGWTERRRYRRHFPTHLDVLKYLHPFLPMEPIICMSLAMSQKGQELSWGDFERDLQQLLHEGLITSAASELSTEAVTLEAYILTPAGLAKLIERGETSVALTLLKMPLPDD